VSAAGSADLRRVAPAEALVQPPAFEQRFPAGHVEDDPTVRSYTSKRCGKNSSRRSSSSRYASISVPRVYYPVMMQRDGVHKNTQGIAHRSSTVRSPNREAGRNPRSRFSMRLINVACPRYVAYPSNSNRPQYRLP
jgi:hypothetical protein